MRMAEKVARAMLAKADDLGIELEYPFDNKLYVGQAATAMAKAAIEAMLEPTNEMLDAGYEWLDYCDKSDENPDIRSGWINMVKEALK